MEETGDFLEVCFILSDLPDVYHFFSSPVHGPQCDLSLQLFGVVALAWLWLEYILTIGVLSE